MLAPQMAMVLPSDASTGFMGYAMPPVAGVYGMGAAGGVTSGSSSGGGGLRTSPGGSGGGSGNPISRPSEPNARKLFVGGLHFKTDDASLNR